MKHAILFLALLPMALQTEAVAQPALEPSDSLGQPEAFTAQQDPRFIALDADKDGYVSRSEAQADPDLAVDFINVDETQDDRLNEKEFAKFLAPKELRIPLPIGIGNDGQQPVIDIKPATPPVNTGPDIAP
jgi:hypothetical protein